MLVWYVLRVMFSMSENTIIKVFIDFSSKETFNHIAFVYVFGRNNTAQLKLKTRSTAFEMKLFKHMALWTAALIGAVKWQISVAFSRVSLLNKRLQLSNTANQVKKHTGSIAVIVKTQVCHEELSSFSCITEKCSKLLEENVTVAPSEMFCCCYGIFFVSLQFNYNSKVSVTLARNENGGENAKLVNPGLSSLHFKNVTIGFSKKGFTKGYSIVPRHKSSLQPNRTFFSSWSIWLQAIKRLVLLLCRQRSVKWKRGVSAEIMSIIKTQCLKTSLRASQVSLKPQGFCQTKTILLIWRFFFLARLLRMNK